MSLEQSHVSSVRTSWLPQAGGRKAVRDKFCLQHMRDNTPLIIVDETTGKRMTIQACDILKMRVGVSKKAFPDKLKPGSFNYLWYFPFIPDGAIQTKMRGLP